MEGAAGAPNKTNNRVTVLVTTFTYPVPGVQNVQDGSKRYEQEKSDYHSQGKTSRINCPVGGAKFYEPDSL